MAWNLVDSMSLPGKPRRFCLPLNSLPADAVVEFSEDAPKDRITDAVFTIRVRPPAEGFVPAGDLPHPSIQLHAVDLVQVRFAPAAGSLADRLILRCLTFATAAIGSGILTEFPKWWARWQEAACIPLRLIYENVDAESIRSLLATIVAPVDDKLESLVPSTNGISLPDGVFAGASKTLFVDEFMQGAGQYVIAEPGAYLGAIAKDATDSATEPSRRLKLHVEYFDHTAQTPHPMNPREFLHLLFGNDSKEALQHPLLLKLNSAGASQTVHESKSMRLRPPFRTHARVLWEADLELPRSAQDPGRSEKWIVTADCKERLYNEPQPKGLKFDRTSYDFCKDRDGVVVGCWKCNLFVLDVALRAGFRVPLIPVGSVWHYLDPKAMVLKIDGLSQQQHGKLLDRVPLNGNVEGVVTTWGYKIDGELRAQSGAKLDSDALQKHVNDAMLIDGRCFIVALKYVSANSTGHMLIVDEVKKSSAFPHTLAALGHGFNCVTVKTREVTNAGAAMRQPVRLNVSTAKIQLIHMLELAPGRDPDTPLGLRDCNVQL